MSHLSERYRFNSFCSSCTSWAYSENSSVLFFIKWNNCVLAAEWKSSAVKL